MKQLSIDLGKNSKVTKGNVTLFLLGIAFLPIVLLSCSINEFQQQEITSPYLSSTPKMTPFVTHYITLPPFIVTPSNTPIEYTVSFYRQIDETYNNYLPIISSTQGPISIRSTKPTIEGVLYQNAIVSVFLGNDIDVMAYLNLDDLDNNGMKNSDIVIELTGQSYSWYLLQPVNGAVFYYTENESIDYQSCLKFFPISGLDAITYSYQGMHFDSKFGSYCVITNEERLAIVQFEKNSINYNEDYSQNLSFIITVYKEKLK